MRNKKKNGDTELGLRMGAVVPPLPISHHPVEGAPAPIQRPARRPLDSVPSRTEPLPDRPLPCTACFVPGGPMVKSQSEVRGGPRPRPA